MSGGWVVCKGLVCSAVVVVVVVVVRVVVVVVEVAVATLVLVVKSRRVVSGTIVTANESVCE